MEQLQASALGRATEVVEQRSTELPEDVEAMAALPREERIALLRALRDPNLH